MTLCATKMSKISNLSLSDVFFQALKAPKLVFGRDSAPQGLAGVASKHPSRLLKGMGRGTPLIDIHGRGVEFLIWRYTFKMVTSMAFHTQKCCHLVCVHTASGKCWQKTI